MSRPLLRARLPRHTAAYPSGHTTPCCGTAYPCVATTGRITGGNVVADGVEAAWRRLHGHGCVACYSPCLVEQNYLLSLDPRVIGQFVRRHLPRFG